VLSIGTLAACAPDLGGLHDPATRGGGSSEGTEATAGDSGADPGDPDVPWDDDATTARFDDCDPASDRCVDAPPPGWQGFVALLPYEQGDVEPRCGGAYPHATEVILRRDPGGVAFSCECECGPVSGASCQGTATMHVTTAPATEACDEGEVFQISSALQEGGTFASGISAWSATPISSQLVGGACEPIERVEFTTPSFAAGAVACGAEADAGTCGHGRRCVAEPAVPFDGAVCIWRPGEVSCPEGSPFSEANLYYGGLDDDRSCSACACDPPVGACTNPALTLAYWLFELVDAETIPADAACHSVMLFDAPGGIINAAIYDAGEPVATCEVGEGAGVGHGGVHGADPVTVCCTPT
jgi:hypothetical protein